MNFISELSESHIKQLHQLYKNEWWTKERTLSETESVVKGSQITMTLVNNQDQLQAFARVLTDYTFKALIFDLIVSPDARGQGLGRKLTSLIREHPELQQVKHFELYCLPDKCSFYETLGFSCDVGEIKLMRLTSD